MDAQKFKNVLKLLFKLAVSAICLWYISKKINWQETFDLLKAANIIWLTLAALFFIASKIISSYRLNFYFKAIDISLSEKQNVKLYWLGMFYNLFLPGGIGGDAYKVISLNKKYDRSFKLLSAAVLLDRVSGVAGLGMLAAVYYLIVIQNVYSISLTGAILPGVLIFYLLIKFFFPTFKKIFTSTLLLGLLVQILQIACAYCLMASIQIPLVTHSYILLFLLSSIVAVLPLTIGGLGAREVVFLWGSKQFGLDIHQAVYISLLFYAITLFVSAAGAFWIFKDPIKNSSQSISG